MGRLRKQKKKLDRSIFVANQKYDALSEKDQDGPKGQKLIKQINKFKEDIKVM